MNKKDSLVSGEKNDDTGNDSESCGIGWIIPEDVLMEWSKLPQEEMPACSLAMSSLLRDINDTLAVVAINTELFPVAAHELQECLKKFRLSLRDAPFPKSTATKILH